MIFYGCFLCIWKVNFILSGAKGETDTIDLECNERKIFNREGIDSFIFSSKRFLKLNYDFLFLNLNLYFEYLNRELGDLLYLNIWHDNSGKGSKASWFLKYIIIRDFQTNESYYFICQDWLSIESDDGLIERLLPVCGQAQKVQFKYLLKKQALWNLRDGHIWFSIFTKPIQSSFTRLNRLTCAFVLLSMNMMVNILYFDAAKDPPSTGLQLGPFVFTPQQVIEIFLNNLFQKSF